MKWIALWFCWIFICYTVGVCVWETWAYSKEPRIENPAPYLDTAQAYCVSGICWKCGKRYSVDWDTLKCPICNKLLDYNSDVVSWRNGMIMIGNMEESRIYAHGDLIATVPYSKVRVEVQGLKCLDLQTFDVSEGQP